MGSNHGQVMHAQGQCTEVENTCAGARQQEANAPPVRRKGWDPSGLCSARQPATLRPHAHLPSKAMTAAPA